jgi:hypothetical protein
MALQRIAGPAIGLLILAILELLGSATSLLGMLVGTGFALPNMSGAPNAEQFDQLFRLLNGPVGIISNVVSLLIGGFLLYGAIKMKNLQNHTLSMIVCVIAMVPCSTCCCIGIPIGIWGLVMINKPEIKAFYT